ncbi:UNVERIFIED_CONTAM: hypothetical protein FKN15_040587 [Acipenser sinensis]
MKKGGEVRRPAPPAALSQQEVLWPEPHGGELLAMEKGGGGQETSTPSRTFAAGDRVVGDPQRGAASHEEEGGGQETSFPSPKISLAGGAVLCPVHREVSTVWVGGGPPAMAATMDI